MDFNIESIICSIKEPELEAGAGAAAATGAWTMTTEERRFFLDFLDLQLLWRFFFLSSFGSVKWRALFRRLCISMFSS